jgi:sulfite reductase (NADPH) flavoprotein alpha-component
MSSSLALPATPLSHEQADAVARLTQDLDARGLWWLSGYAAGLASRDAQPAAPLAAPVRGETATPGRVSIVYGSQTGNARRVAEQLAADAESAGLGVRLLRADEYPTRELKHERHLYLVLSTQGDGDPSDDARDLHDFLLGPRAPRLEHLHFAVLGLGDSSYPQFCVVGQRIDARLAELGAQRVLPRGDADLDIDGIAAPWRAHAVAAAKDVLKPSATVTPLRPQPAQAAPTFGRERPFQAELLVNQRITAAASGKDVRHVELSLDDAQFAYEPGDALGVWPRNPDALVEAVLDTLGLDGDAEVTHDGVALPLRVWLGEKRELTKLSRPFVASHAQHARSDELNRLLAPEHAERFARLLAEQQVVDLLQRFDGGWSAEELVAALRPLTPRLYSIASSRKAVGDEAHLTVAHVEYEHAGQTRWGAASHFLAARDSGARVPVFLEPNDRFRLPADASRDIVMIGPGTGVAPFRAFVQERAALRSAATGRSGRNWLFFGNPHFRSDFLYQLEWQRALKNGTLDRIDLAFSRDVSRDAARKVYVQDRIRERGAELDAWLRNGAHLYVCGGIAMARDVHAALLDVVAAHNGGDRDAAGAFLRELQQQRRYAKDVY